MKRIANVLTGVATLFVRQPNDALASWSTEQRWGGATHSVKLYKGGSGNAGSTHLQIIPPAGITLENWMNNIANYGFDYYNSAVTGNFIQMEFKFEDPNSNAWAELTIITQQTHAGQATWTNYALQATDVVGYGGWTEDGTTFSEWGLTEDVDGIDAIINAIGAGTACGDWLLTRVRLELWECSPERTSYIGAVRLNSVDYTIAPGGTAPAMSLSSPYTEVGYTEDGVTFEYSVDMADIDVEEETFSLDRVATKEVIAVTCNMAESSLANLNNAIAGSVLVGNMLTIGDGVNKKLNLKIQGTDPDGYLLTIELPRVTATGTVGFSYKKSEKTIFPVTFQALKPATGKACRVVYNAA